MEFGLAALASRGFVPKTIIDVGAFEGESSKMARRLWPQSQILMIEPNFAKQTKLSIVANDVRASVFCELLGAEDDAIVSYNVMESRVGHTKRTQSR